MRVTLLLADSQPFRLLFEIELDSPPLPGEMITIAPRTYRVLERSWRIDLPPEDAVLRPPEDSAPRVGVGLLLSQLSGPPHVITAPQVPH